MTTYFIRRGYCLFSNNLFVSNFKRRMSSNQGLSLENVLTKLQQFADLSLSEKWDNTGVLIEPFTARPITKILLTNDLTEDVLEEAVLKKTELIISYHPPIFSPLKSVTQKTWKERIVVRCLENKIALYSPHTSWDAVSGGVNDWLAECLPEHNKQPISEGSIPGMGPGRICSLLESVPLEKIINSLKQHTGLSHLQLGLARGATLSSEIKTVALCAGSGASLLRGIKADLYLTGEMGHHEVLDAVHNGASVILTNHSNSERGFLHHFGPKLQDRLNNQAQVIVSVKDRDPLETV